MSKQTPGLDEAQVHKAVAALLKFLGRQHDSANELLPDDEFVHLILSLKRIPQGARKDKPVRIPVPHPLYAFDSAEVCLFVKDHKGEGHKAAKRRLEKTPNSGIAKVVGLSKLRGKYEPHEAKRQLCSSYDLFVADERILPSLPKLLGKAFFKKKKQPVPVKLSGKDWAGQVRRALEATYMFPSSGPCLNIKVGRSSFSEQQCVDNVLAVLKEALQHVPKKWEGIQSVYLKSADSVSLPVFQRAPESALRIEA